MIEPILLKISRAKCGVGEKHPELCQTCQQTCDLGEARRRNGEER